MKFDLRSNQDAVLKRVRQAEKQARYAMVRTLNDVAFQVRAGVQKQMDVSFDRVTPYIRKSVLVDKATRERLTAYVTPEYLGGKGGDPQDVLHAEVFGGRRKSKRSERAFQRVGLLPSGWALVPTGHAPRDAWGNVPGSFIVQLISYFQAFGEVGYRANMSARRKAQLAKKGVSARGYRTTGGVEYFVSRGHGRGGHLPPGIYQRRGIHGSDIKMLFAFVPPPTYPKRLAFFEVSRRTARNQFEPTFRRYYAEAMRTAK